MRRTQPNSIVELLRDHLTPDAQLRFMELITPEAAFDIYHDWDHGGVSRPKQRLPSGDWSTWLMLSGRGFGKAVKCECVIPTPYGWTCMGDIEAGDTVFDQAGKPTLVTHAFEPFLAREAYRVTFSDGASVDVCGDHQWTVLTHQFRKQLYRYGGSLEALGGNWPLLSTLQRHDRWGNPKGDPVYPITATTRKLIGIMRRETVRGDLNLCIPTTKPLVLPAKTLPIGPWSIGYMLGNIGGAVICTGSDGQGNFDHDHVLCALELEGTPVVSEKMRWEVGSGLINVGNRFSHIFHDLTGGGGARNKRIPPMYLRASIAQRLDLLRGLMDADGHAMAQPGAKSVNFVEFCSMSKGLALDVVELARSLGQKPVLSEGRAMLDGVDHGTKYRVSWRPTLQCFTLPRKADRLEFGGPQYDRSFHRMITSIEPIEPTLMRCISVDTPSRLYLAGDGMIPTHNSRTLSGVLRKWALDGHHQTGALVGATSDDVRRVMIEGESGIMATTPKHQRPLHKKVDRALEWPNGAMTYLYSAEDPDRFRGGNNSYILADELAAWKKAQDAWDQAQLTLRAGPNPRNVVATTPRATLLIRKLASSPTTVLTTGATSENRANLAQQFLDKIVSTYEGTRLGMQELEGKILTDIPSALWRSEYITYGGDPAQCTRIVVGVDPSGTAKGDECGIVVAGLLPDKNVLVLDDASVQGTPSTWAARVAQTFDLWRADVVVAETNFGGDLVLEVLAQHAPALPVRKIHASRGKVLRAEPVALQYENGRVKHLRPFPALEQQMTQMSADPSIGFSGKGSPDRADAAVHAITALTAGRLAPTSARASSPPKAA